MVANTFISITSSSTSIMDTSHFPWDIYCLSISCPPHELFYSIEWVVNSSATCHICSEKNCFTSLIHSIPTSLIMLLDGTHYIVSLGGDVWSGDCILLCNILFMSKLHFNLMVVSKTTDLDVNVYFLRLRLPFRSSHLREWLAGLTEGMTFISSTQIRIFFLIYLCIHLF